MDKLSEIALEGMRVSARVYGDLPYTTGLNISAKDLKLLLARMDMAEAEIAALRGAAVEMPEGLSESTRDLVVNFASAMAQKLHKAEVKYGWAEGWKQSDWQEKCLADFNHHIAKGDPLDVANYCAFMHHHGWATALTTKSADGEEL